MLDGAEPVEQYVDPEIAGAENGGSKDAGGPRARPVAALGGRQAPGEAVGIDHPLGGCARSLPPRRALAEKPTIVLSEGGEMMQTEGAEHPVSKEDEKRHNLEWVKLHPSPQGEPGEIRQRGGAIISRYEWPVLFWFWIALLCLVSFNTIVDLINSPN